MKKTATLAGAVLLMAVTSFPAASQQQPYKVIMPVSAELNDSLAYLINFDTGSRVDSVLVKNGTVTFTGSIDEPIAVRLKVNGMRDAPNFILEPGTISFHVSDKGTGAFGTELNDRLRELTDRTMELSQEYGRMTTNEGRDSIYKAFNEVIRNVTQANLDNPLGLLTFLMQASSYEPAELIAFVKANPYLGRSQKVSKMVTNAKNCLATQPGKKMVDFEVTYDGKTERLSDYVGKGKYVLVDYWASWCGPCKRQIPVLKEILAEYGNKGLEVLGVAVWDKPEDTKKAIKDHQIPWHTILDAQTIPTDLYGIPGIPCIILYGPDGTILSRDKQSDDLKADVKAAFDGTLKY